MNITQINAAVDAAFIATSALETPIMVASAPLDTNCTIRTDVYEGPQGKGFVVTAILDLTFCKVVHSRQSGPETFRERAFPTLEVLAPLMQTGFDNAVNAGFADSDLNVTVGITEGDRVQFDALYSHLLRKGAPDGFVLTLATIDRIPFEVTVVEFKGLLVRAGDYYAGLWVTKLQQDALIRQ